jgi:hypothetical protein
VVRDVEASNHSATLTLKEDNMTANVTYTRNCTDYRQIWINHYGPIPKDEHGRSYHIHHRNGNKYDNRIENLQCVSIQEHYDIHLKQGDWGAAKILAQILKLSQSKIRLISSTAAKAQVANRTHPWIKKKQCEWCHGTFYVSPYAKYHGDRCLSNPNAMPRKKKECQWCHRILTLSHYTRFHGDRCLSNPNAIARKPRKLHNEPRKRKQIMQKKQCEWCHKSIDPRPYAKFHGDKCKLKPRESSSQLSLTSTAVLENKRAITCQ